MTADVPEVLQLSADVPPVTSGAFNGPLPCVPEPGACGCIGHRIPGVSHIVACCDEPHVEYIDLTPSGKHRRTSPQAILLDLPSADAPRHRGPAGG